MFEGRVRLSHGAAIPGRCPRFVFLDSFRISRFLTATNFCPTIDARHFCPIRSDSVRSRYAEHSKLNSRTSGILEQSRLPQRVDAIGRQSCNRFYLFYFGRLRIVHRYTSIYRFTPHSRHVHIPLTNTLPTFLHILFPRCSSRRPVYQPPHYTDSATTKVTCARP